MNCRKTLFSNLFFYFQFKALRDVLKSHRIKEFLIHQECFKWYDSTLINIFVINIMRSLTCSKSAAMWMLFSNQQAVVQRVEER